MPNDTDNIDYYGYNLMSGGVWVGETKLFLDQMKACKFWLNVGTVSSEGSMD